MIADTSFWFARHVTADRNHPLARRILPAPAVITTEIVLGETWTLINRRVGHAAAVRCTRAIRRRLPGASIEPVSDRDHKRAWEWLEHHDEREFSFVDAVSYAVMRACASLRPWPSTGTWPLPGSSRSARPERGRKPPARSFHHQPPRQPVSSGGQDALRCIEAKGYQ